MDNQGTDSDLEDVGVFVQVVRSGSFTRAGGVLGLPKSTVSRRVAVLEDRLGVRLLERTTRRLSLTELGRSYFERVATHVDDLRAAGRALQELDSQPRGVLRVTAPPDAHMTTMIAKYQRRFPEVRVVLNATAHRIDLVAEGYDLALRAGDLPDSSLVARRLFTSHLALFASPGYLVEHGNPVRVAELAQHACLAFGTRFVRTTWTLQRDGQQEQVAVQGPLACNDFGVIRVAAQEGLGIALLPELVGAAPMLRGELIRVLPEYRGPGGPVHAVYPSGRMVTPKVRSFVDFAQAEFREAFAQLQRY